MKWLIPTVLTVGVCTLFVACTNPKDVPPGGIVEEGVRAKGPCNWGEFETYRKIKGPPLPQPPESEKKGTDIENGLPVELWKDPQGRNYLRFPDSSQPDAYYEFNEGTGLRPRVACPVPQEYNLDLLPQDLDDDGESDWAICSGVVPGSWPTDVPAAFPNLHISAEPNGDGSQTVTLKGDITVMFAYQVFAWGVEATHLSSFPGYFHTINPDRGYVTFWKGAGPDDPGAQALMVGPLVNDFR